MGNLRFRDRTVATRSVYSGVDCSFLFSRAEPGLLAALLIGSFERVLIFGFGPVVFWSLFYFVWIGIHWIRFIWGVWNISVGFCLLIWAWRDMSGPEAISGSICLFIGGCLCFSPSIYFFAKRQREFVHWPESLLVGAVCFLMLCSIGLGTIGFSVFRQQREEDARTAADDVNRHIYVEQDLEWTTAHVTRASLQRNGYERLLLLFDDTKTRLGKAREISHAKATVVMRLSFPPNIESDARVVATAEMDDGPVELNAILWDGGNGWQIDRMWWKFLPVSDATPASE